MPDIFEYNLVIIYPLVGSKYYLAISEWNIELVLAMCDTKDIYGFHFELRRKVIEKNSCAGRIDIDIQKMRTSGMYYINCYMETMEDLLVKPAQNSVLLKQMQSQGIKKVACTISGNMIYPFREGDVLLDRWGKVIEC